MKRLGYTVVKNALANTVRGGATAIVALVLPHFLTHTLDTDRFAAWALMLQIAAYANYLDFGLQTSLARYLAQAIERQEHERRDGLVSTAVALLLAAAPVALLVIGLVLFFLPRLAPSLPSSMMGEFRLAVTILGGSTALLLPFSAFSGVLIGIHKNEYTAMAVGGSRILGAVAVLIAVRYTHSLVWLAMCVAASNLLGGIAQVLFVRLLLPNLDLGWRRVDRAVGKSLAGFSAGLTVWSLSGLLVSGLDLTILGYFRFDSVGYYAIGASLVTFIAGLNGAMSSAMMTPLAALHAGAATDRIKEITLRSSRIGTYANLLFTVVIFLAGHQLLRLWVGLAYANEARPILDILMVATTVRLVCGPYAAMLVATGQQRQGIAQGVVEGVANLVSSIVLGYKLGAVGVALGTLVGAVCGIMWTCVFTLHRADEFPLPRRAFITESIARPLGATLPLLAFVAWSARHPLTPISWPILISCCLLTYFLTDRLGNVLPARYELGKDTDLRAT